MSEYMQPLEERLTDILDSLDVYESHNKAKDIIKYLSEDYLIVPKDLGGERDAAADLARCHSHSTFLEVVRSKPRPVTKATGGNLMAGYLDESDEIATYWIKRCVRLKAELRLQAAHCEAQDDLVLAQAAVIKERQEAKGTSNAS